MVGLFRSGSTGRVVALAGLALLIAGCQTTQVDQVRIESTPPQLSQSAYAMLLADADEALQDGDYEFAFNRYQQILQSVPDDFPAKFGIAEVQLAIGDWNSAMAMYREMKAPQEYTARLSQGKGLALLMAGRTDRALSKLEDAVEGDPQLWRAWNAIGYIRDSKHEFEIAQESYRRAIEIQPDSAAAHNNLGMSHLLQGNHEAAEKAFVKALVLDPNLKLARVNLRLVLAWQGKYAEALHGLPRKSAPRVLNNVGYIAMLRGDFADAEGYLTRSMEASPSFNEGAWENMRQLAELKKRKM